MVLSLTDPAVQAVVSVVLIIWGIVWALLSMWKSAKLGHKVWFVLIFICVLYWYLDPNIISTILGLFGALPILYFYIFSRFRFKDNKLVFEKWKKKHKKKS